MFNCYLYCHYFAPGVNMAQCTVEIYYVIENALISSALQRSSFGPDVQAIAQTQALVRDDPHFLFTVMTKVYLVLFSIK